MMAVVLAPAVAAAGLSGVLRDPRFTHLGLAPIAPALADTVASTYPVASASASVEFVYNPALGSTRGPPRRRPPRRATGSSDRLGALAQDRTQHPGAAHDHVIMSELVQAELDGDRLTAFELNAFFMFLSVAGNETTRNAAAHGLNAFLEHPQEYDKLVQDSEGLIGSTTEEILRWASPVMYLRRNITRDTELRGQALMAGDKVSLWYVSANRDEDVFADPFRFDVARQPNEHVAFGAGGPHFCLGASLARMEIRVLFEGLARRVPVLRSLGAAAPLRSNIVAGIKHPPPVDLSATPVRSS